MSHAYIEKNIVAVNATALDKSGALTILKQFLKYSSLSNDVYFYCFVPEGLNLQVSDNIFLIEVPKMSWVSRIFWDSYKFKRTIEKKGIKPNKVISLQNTSVNINVEQIIYLHQPLPFSNMKWNVFKREEFKLFLYKHFYKFFILKYTTNKTIFVVQTDWMKTALCSRSQIKDDNVYIIKPDIVLPNIKKINNKKTSSNNVYSFLYPATPLFYKNHLIILEALKLLNDEVEGRELKFQVTFNPTDFPAFTKKVNELNLTQQIEYLGVVPYEELINFYQISSIVVFPSFVETFGLPLAEGATLGKPVLCSDFDFSRDVLGDYPGAKFLNYKDANAWKVAIQRTLNELDNQLCNYDDFEFKYSSSWEDFFKLL